MTTSAEKSSRSRRVPAWLRRAHRWIGLATVFFVLLLSVTGIALNHANDWQLDRRYVAWPWLVSALGMNAPEPSASFEDGGHKVTRLGQRTYFDTREIMRELDSLRGMVTLDDLAIVATREAILLLTLEGDVVEYIDLSPDLPEPIGRIGRLDGVPIIDSGGDYFASNEEITGLVAWQGEGQDDIRWSTASELSPRERAIIEDLYRGRGLTVERLLIEIHSGRIIGAAGPLYLDIVALGLIALSISGLAVWWRRGRQQNGARHKRRKN